MSNRSKTVSESATAVDIITNKRSIKTTVQLEDGALLVLGGLIDETARENEQKIPGLGDIPILGALFRYKTESRLKQNLLVFIRATIIKDSKIARRLSHRKYNFIRDLQGEAISDGLNELPPALVPYDDSIDSSGEAQPVVPIVEGEASLKLPPDEPMSTIVPIDK